MISVCCVTDDKPGHKSQLDGLLAALQRQRSIREQWLHLDHPTPVSKPLDLIICAGRLTHWPALMLRWRLGGRVIRLSKSWLPSWLFDLNIFPAHDGVPESRRVFNTVGSMNAILPSSEQDAQRGLILVGGPAANHGWDNESILQQILTLIQSCPQIRWTLTTSRRTPEACNQMLCEHASAGYNYVPLQETSRDWLRRQYRECGVIWVSEDSVSMVCESLSSGAIVGALSVPRLKTGRVSGNLDQLIASGHVLSLTQVERDGLPAQPLHPPLQEAERAASRLLQWLDQQ